MRDHQDRYTAFLEAVRSSPHNLVSQRAAAELETRHLPESIALARLLPAESANVVDVGSGGGFPGLVIAVARPDLAVTLVEATGKKVRFLERAAQQLGVAVDVIHGRIERLHVDLGGRFDLATARAVAPLHKLVGWVLPVLRPEGLFYAVKGESWEADVHNARLAIAAANGYLHAVPPDPQAIDESVDPPLRAVIIGRRVDGGSDPTLSPQKT